MKEGWEIKKLGEVATFQRGLTYSKSDEVEFSNNCVLRSNNIELESMSILLDDLKYIREDFVVSVDKKVKVNTILICMSNGSKQHIGKVAFIEKEYDYAFGGFMGLIVPNSNISAKYVYYFCLSSSYKRFLAEVGNGANITNIKFSDLSKLTIPVPPLEEQERIVGELDCLSGVIEKKKQQLKELDALAQSIFYEMFGNPVENDRGWEMKKLGEIAIIGTGATPSRQKEDIYYGGNIPWVKTTEVQNCEIISTEESITELAVEQTNCKIYPSGTLLIAMYGQGKTRGQVAKLKISATTNQACAAIMLNKDLSNLEFVYEFLLINYENIRDMAQGGNQANLNLKLVSSISIPIPPLSLQQEFAEKIESIEKQKELIRKSIEEVEMLFNSRMDYYFG